MTNLFTFAMVSSSAESGTGSSGSSATMLIMMVVLFAAMYFFTIRPQKKQQKKEQELRDNTQVGDEIVTIGGICGRVVAVKEDTVTVETGSDRNKMIFKKYAIQLNVTANEKIQAEREAARAAMQEKKEKTDKKDKKSKKEDKE